MAQREGNWKRILEHAMLALSYGDGMNVAAKESALREIYQQAQAEMSGYALPDACPVCGARWSCDHATGLDALPAATTPTICPSYVCAVCYHEKDTCSHCDKPAPAVPAPADAPRWTAEQVEQFIATLLNQREVAYIDAIQEVTVIRMLRAYAHSLAAAPSGGAQLSLPPRAETAGLKAEPFSADEVANVAGRMFDWSHDERRGDGALARLAANVLEAYAQSLRAAPVPPTPTPFSREEVAMGKSLLVTCRTWNDFNSLNLDWFGRVLTAYAATLPSAEQEQR